MSHHANSSSSRHASSLPSSMCQSWPDIRCLNDEASAQMDGNCAGSVLQDSFKPPCSNIALGDERISPFTTSYSTDFYAPFDKQKRLRSPMRNKDLALTQTSLKEHYASSYNRVGE